MLREFHINVKQVLTLICTIVIYLSFCGCKERVGYYPVRVSGVIWGTSYTIIYNQNNVSGDINMETLITAALSSVDSAANAFSPVSEISRFNHDGILRRPSPNMIRLLKKAIEINHLTSGSFDPTIGPLVDMWGFGAGDSLTIVNSESIDSVLAFVGMDKIKLVGDSVTMQRDGMRLDFGAIAKGYGVDRVSEALKTAGIEDYMVEIGGEVRVNGFNPRGDAWAIQIDAPITDREGRHCQLSVLDLKNASVATSGNYRNFRYDSSGRLLYHTISPVTGRPAISDILSATIVAHDAMTADALATAAMVMGREKAERLIRELASDRESGVYGAVFITAASDDSEYLIHSVALNPAHVVLQE